MIYSNFGIIEYNCTGIMLFLLGMLSCLGKWDAGLFPKFVFALFLFVEIFFLAKKRLRSCAFRNGKISLWYGTFFAISLFSMTYTVNQIDASEMLRRLLFVFVIFFLFSQLTAGKEHLKYLFWGVIWGALLTECVTFIVEFPFIGVARLGNFSCGAATNYAGILLSGFFSVILLMRFFGSSIFLKLCCVLFFVGVVLSGSRMPLVAFFCVSLAYNYINKENILKKARILMILLIVLFGAYELMMNVDALYEVMGRRIEGMIATAGGSKYADSSIEGRSNMKVSAFELWQQSPIIGHGINSFWVLSNETGGARIDSHCGYTTILCFYGILGFVVFYVPIVFTMLKAFVMRNEKSMFLGFLVLMILVMDYQAGYYGSSSMILIIGCIMKILDIMKSEKYLVR